MKNLLIVICCLQALSHLSAQSCNPDVTDPVVSCTGGNFFELVNAGNCDAAVVNFQADAEASMMPTDNCAVDAVICSPSSGSTFSLGTTPVQCTAYDAAGNASQTCTFIVEVVSSDLYINASNITEESCPGASDGSIDATPSGGNPPYSYNWSNGATTQDILGLSPGSYTVTVTDAIGCTYSETGTISPTLDVTDPVVTCNGNGFGVPVNTGNNCNAGIINFQNAVEASMNPMDDCGIDAVICTPASGSVFPIGQSLVTCIAYDLAGNSSNQCTFTVEVFPSSITIDATGGITDESCTGANDGAIDATVSGSFNSPFSYSWSNGGIAEDIASLAPGTYTVTVTDNAGCVASTTAVVSTNQDNTDPIVSCTGGNFFELVNTGNCDAAVVNFQADAESSMMPTDDCGVDMVICSPASGSTFSLGTTPVQCTAYDLAGNSSQTCTFIVEVVSSDLYINAGTITDESCIGAADGAIDATPSGGNPPYSYNWSNGATTQDISGLSPGSYTVTVIDAIGCTYAETRVVSTITDNTDPVVSCTGPVFTTIADEPFCSGTVVDYQSFAEASMAPTDDCGIDFVLCVPAPGSTFLVGNHTVTCQAYDLSGNQSAQCSFSIIVQPCFCPTNRIFPSSVASGVYNAQQTISSYGTIPTSTNVNFEAGQCINLTEGFEVEAQAVFLAEIVSCN